LIETEVAMEEKRCEVNGEWYCSVVNGEWDTVDEMCDGCVGKGNVLCEKLGNCSTDGPDIIWVKEGAE